ncbi:hypothetical protein [Hymenobacter sp.]|uniref:hypothetical protein n=1 Tax=Hymenobacter sp. TaxID=1898978 RepID=UPI002ED902F4
MLFARIDCGSNQNPTLAPVRVNNNSTPVVATPAILAVADQLLSLQLTDNDANATQVIALNSNAEQVLANAGFVASAPGTEPTITLNRLPHGQAWGATHGGI